MKINSSAKKTYCIINIDKKDFIILNKLINLNIIGGYEKITDTSVCVYILKSAPFLKNIKILHKIREQRKINLKTIKKINKIKKSIYILTTSRGLITNIEAENMKIGGLIIARI